VKEQELRLMTDDGLSLEASLTEPEKEARGAAVICHPHPKMGGTMNAPLLLAVAERLLADGWAVFRFNFRGIGSSEGTSSIGIEEVADARAALTEAARRFPGVPRALVGWSFGAAVAVRLASEEEVAGLVAIAPAVLPKEGITAGLPSAEETSLGIPTTLIIGENDDLVAPADAERWAADTEASFIKMRGANHFFWGKYDALAEKVAESLVSLLMDGDT
jgi:alpha/beta superfamily hydrolase